MLAVAACGGSDSDTVSTTSVTSGATSPSTATPVTTGKPRVSFALRQWDAYPSYKILVDDEDRTLYTYGNDAPGTSTCTGGCAETWPPVIVATIPEVDDANAVVASELGTIERIDGGTQLTLNGYPLYRYSGDRAAGDTNGDGIGGVWHAAIPSSTRAVDD